MSVFTDVLGIPSSLLMVYLAHYIHIWTQPHWSTLYAMAIQFVAKTLEICETRVYKPLKGMMKRHVDNDRPLHLLTTVSSKLSFIENEGIADDVLNRNTAAAAFSVDDEQGALDRMLRDLGCGDGSTEMRREALGEARDIYERDLKKGLLRNIVGGQLIRLLLIQVQQLKVGLLSALDNIDTLLNSNRINFQILAAIPAVILVWFIFRYLSRFVYNIRAQDLRPVTYVHSDMYELLEKIESILLLNDPFVRLPGGATGRSSEVKTLPLGELTLCMYRYLSNLNLSSPPFPAYYCDQIHSW